jgi:hypothetical protein
MLTPPVLQRVQQKARRPVLEEPTRVGLSQASLSVMSNMLAGTQGGTPNDPTASRMSCYTETAKTGQVHRSA